MKKKFVGRCVELNGQDIEEMTEDAHKITLDEFRTQVDTQELERLLVDLGYGAHFPIERDWHVQYFRGHYRGRSCVYMVWSAIEHVFV